MKAENIGRKTFCDDKKRYAYIHLEKWLYENPNTDIFNISDYNVKHRRYIIVYYDSTTYME